MPYSEVPTFIAALRQRPAIAARAWEFAILTAARTNEAIGARWAEIDFDAKVWTIPAERMKADREHRIPLSAPALAILKEMRELGGDFVFPGDRTPTLRNMPMLMLLRRMKIDATVHGFRSSFRDWTGDATNFPRELCEAALAHVVGDKAEQAHRRSDALEKRRELMESWATYMRRIHDAIVIGRAKKGAATAVTGDFLNRPDRAAEGSALFALL
jgi:integrase